jgi:hypothetical protein
MYRGLGVTSLTGCSACTGAASHCTSSCFPFRDSSRLQSPASRFPTSRSHPARSHGHFLGFHSTTPRPGPAGAQHPRAKGHFWAPSPPDQRPSRQRLFQLHRTNSPVVDRDDFMRASHGSGCDLSLLLLQAIYTIASRSFGGHGDLEDPDLTPRAFYKKAKALYDSGYEQNPTAILQAVVLLSVYWDGPDGTVSPPPCRLHGRALDRRRFCPFVQCTAGPHQVLSSVYQAVPDHGLGSVCEPGFQVSWTSAQTRR